VLHQRATDECARAAQRQSASFGGAGAGRDDRQYLPVLELQPVCRGRYGCPRREIGMADAISKLNTGGHATRRIDALEGVTGRATYTGDVRLPGMLYARVLRSPHPHANIRSIDVSKALAMPGVKAVLTHENCKVVWGAGSIAGGVQYSDD